MTSRVFNTLVVASTGTLAEAHRKTIAGLLLLTVSIAACAADVAAMAIVNDELVVVERGMQAGTSLSGQRREAIHIQKTGLSRNVEAALVSGVQKTIGKLPLVLRASSAHLPDRDARRMRQWLRSQVSLPPGAQLWVVADSSTHLGDVASNPSIWGVGMFLDTSTARAINVEGDTVVPYVSLTLAVFEGPSFDIIKYKAVARHTRIDFRSRIPIEAVLSDINQLIIEVVNAN